MSNSAYPGSLDTFVNPTSSDVLNSSNPLLLHHYQHGLENDAILALETKVGITNSSDTNSLDYKINHLSSSGSGASSSKIQAVVQNYVGAVGQSALLTLFGSSVTASSDGNGVVVPGTIYLPGVTITDIVPGTPIIVGIRAYNTVSGTHQNFGVGLAISNTKASVDSIQINWQTDNNQVVYSFVNSVAVNTPAHSYGNTADTNIHSICLKVWPYFGGGNYALGIVDFDSNSVISSYSNSTLNFVPSNTNNTISPYISVTATHVVIIEAFASWQTFGDVYV